MKVNLNEQAIADEREQAIKRYGSEEKAELYIEGLIDGAKIYEFIVEDRSSEISFNDGMDD